MRIFKSSLTLNVNWKWWVVAAILTCLGVARDLREGNPLWAAIGAVMVLVQIYCAHVEFKKARAEKHEGIGGA